MPGLDHNEIECLQALLAELSEQQRIDLRDTLQLAVDEPDPQKQMAILETAYPILNLSRSTPNGS